MCERAFVFPTISSPSFTNRYAYTRRRYQLPKLKKIPTPLVILIYGRTGRLSRTGTGAGCRGRCAGAGTVGISLSIPPSLPPSLPLWMAAIDVFACENMHAHTHTHTHMTACVQTHTHSLGGGRRGVLVRARNGMSLIRSFPAAAT